MSIWFQYTVTAIGDKKAIGKFFNLDPNDDIHGIEDFEFSFGQKNIPGMRLGKLVIQNPDLIFLTKVQSDYDIVWYIEKFDCINNKVQHIFIERIPNDCEYGGHEVNKLILGAYKKQFPYLMDQHNSGKREYEWRWFFHNYPRTLFMLNEADKYKEIINLLPPMTEEEFFEEQAMNQEGGADA